MKLLFIAIICLSLQTAVAQKGSGPDVITDNGSEVNADGTNDFKTPIGLDLMGGNTKGLTIYPNQNDDYVLISVAGKANEKRQITMTSLTGKQVYKTTNRLENTFMLDTTGLGKGIYVIEVVSGNKVYRKKWSRG
ncbi:MAG: T9SS type A sorting domain-containing protein [Flavobacterium sp.]|nr:MAG: T9SS type A sorting domain-containing protein [Flavobacterium sp.]